MNFEQLIADVKKRYLADIPDHGHLAAGMRLKRALVERLGINDSYRICSEVLGVPAVDCVRLRLLKSMRDAAIERATEFRELWRGGNSFLLDPPRVIGEGNHEPVQGHSRSAYLACFEDIAVRGRSALLLSGNDALLDFEGEEFLSVEDQLEYDPAVLFAAPGAVWTMEAQNPPFVFTEAFYLAGSHTIDFGHWMIEYLPKYMIALKAGLEPRVPLLVDEKIPSTHIQSLELLMPASTQIIKLPHLEAARIHRLWYAPDPVYAPIYPKFNLDWARSANDPNKFSVLRQEMVRRVEKQLEPAIGPERIFIARKPNRHRKLINFAEVEAIAEARHFKIVYPEKLSFLEQVRIAYSAKYILGPEGSGLFLTFFSQSGTRLCVLNPPFTLHLTDQSNILEQLGIDVTIFTGVTVQDWEDFPQMSDYKVELTAFSEFLDQWLGVH